MLIRQVQTLNGKSRVGGGGETERRHLLVGRCCLCVKTFASRSLLSVRTLQRRLRDFIRVRRHELLHACGVCLLVVGLQDLLGRRLQHRLGVRRGHELLSALIHGLGLRGRELARLVAAGDLLGTCLDVLELECL